MNVQSQTIPPQAKQVIEGLKTDMQNELQQLLGWWMQHMLDEQNGGFIGRIDGNNQKYPKAPKGIILNSRILWTFSQAAQLNNQVAYQSMAERAYQYLVDHFIDQSEGGVFWMLNYEGIPLENKKQIYAQAFSIYALSEYYLLCKHPTVLEQAMELFWLIEKYSRDRQRGGYFEAFDQNWMPLDDLRLSTKDMNASKTMNTHLHILEAYTNLYRIAPKEEVKEALSYLIELFLDRFIDPQTAHLHLFFDEDWQLQSKDISFGHDIECSWLLWEAAEVLAEPNLLKRVRSTCLTMVTTTLTKGLDKDGSLWNEKSPDDHIDKDKIWWVQAETLVGLINAWQLTQEAHYLHKAVRNWNFIQNHIKDTEQGEWHWMLKANGEVNRKEDKAGPWKAPYHNARACMQLLMRLND